ncbi:hypothetical protein P4V41_05830 [Fictibacillus nanhaiensis]|uniref:hypothetical protein n=1 Tax=Fictibacillus nanhaiensis TaxID=742169 RepID=UPI002E1CC513|nr:hypothetical protein [Fictibacillus nanhaiensis]
MDTFIKSYHEMYDAAKVNELLLRIKEHQGKENIAAKVTEAMEICGFPPGDIEQVLKQLRGGDRP